MVTAKLICVFVFAYADCWFSHEAAHLCRKNTATAQLNSAFVFALSKILFSHNTAHLILIIPGFGTTATTASSGGLFGTATPSGGGLFGSSSTTGRGNFSVYELHLCCENNCHQSFRLCMF